MRRAGLSRRAGGRLSGGGQFSPRSLANLELWLRADTGVTTGATLTWRDLSGHGYTFSQSTGANQPAVSSHAQLNGCTTLSFDGTNDFLLCDQAASSWRFLHDGTGCEVFFVFVQTGTASKRSDWLSTCDVSLPASSQGLLCASYADTSYQHYLAVQNGAGATRPVDSGTTNTLADDCGHIYNAQHSSAGSTKWQTYADGVSVASSASYAAALGAGTPAYPLTLGASAGGAAGFAQGHLAEVLVYKRVLSAAERALVNAYLESRYFVWSPASLGSNLLAWYRADLGITTATGVSVWADQSGRGDSARHLLQATGGAQPAYSSAHASFNTRPAVVPDGTNDYLQSGTWSAAVAQPFTTFAAAAASGTGTKTLVDSLSGGHASLGTITAAGNANANFGSSLSTATAWTSAQIVAAVANGGSTAIYQGNATTATSGAGGANGASGATVFADNGLASNWWNGACPELFFVSGAASLTDRQNAFAYMSRRYRVMVTL